MKQRHFGDPFAESIYKLSSDGSGSREGLPDRAPAADIPAVRSESAAGMPGSVGGGGGAGDLTEPDYAARTFYTAQTFTSSDGAFTFEVTPAHTIVMQDGVGFSVTLTFDEP